MTSKKWIYKSIVILNQNELFRLNALPQKSQKYIENGALPDSQKSKNQKKIFLGSYFCAFPNMGPCRLFGTLIKVAEYLLVEAGDGDVHCISPGSYSSLKSKDLKDVKLFLLST